MPESNAPAPDPAEPRSGAPRPFDAEAALRRLGAAGWLGVVWTVLPALGGFYLLARIAPVSEFFAARGAAGPFLFALMFALTAGLGLLPTYAQAVVAGWVFGASYGLGAALLGFLGGALLGYAVTKLLSQDRLRALLDEHPKAGVVRRAFLERGFLRSTGVTAVLRFPPNMPFALSNLAMAGAGVGLGAFALGTLIGMTPRTAVAVFFASAASRTGAADIQSFVEHGLGPWVFAGGVLAMLLCLMALGALGKRALRQVVLTETREGT